VVAASVVGVFSFSLAEVFLFCLMASAAKKTFL
jgi:hypothetical protein